MVEPLQLCTFHVDDLFLGLEVTRVKEVLRPQPTTRVPHAPAVVRGLINLRGQLVTAVELRGLFGLPPAAGGEGSTDAESMNVVVRVASGPVSLLVDAIGDVVEVADPGQLQRPPETLTGPAAEFVRAVHPIGERLLLLLDLDQLLAPMSAPSGART